MAYISSIFTNVLIGCFLLLLEEVDCEVSCEKLEASSKRMVYTASENEDINLFCDISESQRNLFGEQFFFWIRFDPKTEIYDRNNMIVVGSDTYNYDWSLIGDYGSELGIKHFNLTTDSTLWCCQVFLKNTLGPVARANYAVLYVEEENVQITMEPSDSSTLQLGDKVSVKCSKTASLLDKIEPSIFWRSLNKPSFRFGPDPAADTISFRVSKDMNGMDIQCGNKYERSNMGGKPLELTSRVIYLKVIFPPEFDEDSSTPSEKSVTVELGKSTKLECGFSDCSIFNACGTKIAWTKISLTSQGKECGSVSTPNGVEADAEKDICFSEFGVRLRSSPKVTLGSEFKNSNANLFLIINNFSNTDTGCYECALQHGGKCLKQLFEVVASVEVDDSATDHWPLLNYAILFIVLMSFCLLSVIITCLVKRHFWKRSKRNRTGARQLRPRI